MSSSLSFVIFFVGVLIIGVLHCVIKFGPMRTWFMKKNDFFSAISEFEKGKTIYRAKASFWKIGTCTVTHNGKSILVRGRLEDKDGIPYVSTANPSFSLDDIRALDWIVED